MIRKDWLALLETSAYTGRIFSQVQGCVKEEFVGRDESTKMVQRPGIRSGNSDQAIRESTSVVSE